MPVNAVNPTSSTQVSPGMISGLCSLQHFPQPIFLITRDRILLETNSQAEQYIEKNWVGVSNQRLHFNGTKHDQVVDRHIDQLCHAWQNDASHNDGERFVLETTDRGYSSRFESNVKRTFRSYSLSRESHHTDNLLLSIHGDLAQASVNIGILAQAFKLTRSESKVLRMMVSGMKPKEIAFEAHISLNTVRSHLRTLYSKMQVRDYNDALRQAVSLMV